MSASDTPITRRSTTWKGTSAIEKSTVSWMRDGIRCGWVPNAKGSCPVFSMRRETPIAVMRTFSRGAFRSGL